MPVYDYKCQKCSEAFTLIMSISDKEKKKIKCPKCKSTKVGQVYSGFVAVTSKKS